MNSSKEMKNKIFQSSCFLSSKLSSDRRMLFSAERDKYPIVILKDTLFDTLKMMMDFMYNGKVDIPANQFEAFLELAVSLQIYGLKDSRGADIGSRAEGNTSQWASRAPQRICEVESPQTNHEGSFSNSSQQYNLGLAQDCTDKPRETSVLCNKSSNSCEMVQPGAISLRDHQSHMVYNESEMSVNTETRVKYLPLDSEIQILEAESKIPDCGKPDKFTDANCMTTMTDESRHSLGLNLGHYSCTQRESSIPLIKRTNSHKVMQSEAVMQGHDLQGHQNQNVYDTEMPVNSERSVEALDSDIEIVDTENISDDGKQDVSTSANFETKMTESSPTFGHNMDQNSCCQQTTMRNALREMSDKECGKKQVRLRLHFRNGSHDAFMFHKPRLDCRVVDEMS